MKLHIGCGRKHLEGYVNIDRYPSPAADVVALAHELNYGDNSVDEILTSHMIEHLTPHDFHLALQEWHRVLKPGGLLRIRCPNFEVYVREWLGGSYTWRWGWGITNIFGWVDRGEGMQHRNGFTHERLVRLLTEAGFQTTSCFITPTRPQTVHTPEYRVNGDIQYEGVKVVRVRKEFRRYLEGEWIT